MEIRPTRKPTDIMQGGEKMGPILTVKIRVRADASPELQNNIGFLVHSPETITFLNVMN